MVFSRALRRGGWALRTRTLTRSTRSASSFASLNLDERLCAALSAQSIDTPTEIQRLAAAPLLAGENALVAAETGSGKTLAYL
eukprot:COSAG04_NODE_5123_length_1728_cov_2.409454_2_plen_82_part_01